MLAVLKGQEAVIALSVSSCEAGEINVLLVHDGPQQFPLRLGQLVEVTLYFCLFSESWFTINVTLCLILD